LQFFTVCQQQAAKGTSIRGLTRSLAIATLCNIVKFKVTGSL